MNPILNPTFSYNNPSSHTNTKKPSPAFIHTGMGLLGGTFGIADYLYKRKENIKWYKETFNTAIKTPDELPNKKVIIDFHKINNLTEDIIKDKKKFNEYLIDTKRIEPLTVKPFLKKFATGAAIFGAVSFLMDKLFFKFSGKKDS